MPTDWADKVRAAITNLETKTDRVMEPDQALAIIDDVGEGKFWHSSRDPETRGAMPSQTAILERCCRAQSSSLIGG
jgi:hypothetical protein